MTDTIRDLLISLASHMAYMQGHLEARHELDDPEDYYWYRESVLLRRKVTDALADEPAVPEVREPVAVTEQSSDEQLLSLDQLRKTWNAQADAANNWDALGHDEIVLWAQRQALARRGNSVPQLEGKVPLPSNADQAALMVILGEQWLSANAPERLCHQAPPADGEAAELVTWLQSIAETIKPNHLAEHQRYKRAAELLQRLSPPQPVPVSERLPGPDDCTAEGRCWLCYTDVCNVTQWTLVVRSAILDWPISHWLPAHALPITQQQENTNDH